MKVRTTRIREIVKNPISSLYVIDYSALTGGLSLRSRVSH
jgi:hypothetical protein